MRCFSEDAGIWWIVAAAVGYVIFMVLLCYAVVPCTPPHPKACLKEIARVFPEAVVYTVEEAGTTTQFTLQDKHGLLRVLIEGDSIDLTSVQRLYKQPTPITDVTPPVYKDSVRVAAGDTVSLKVSPPSARDTVSLKVSPPSARDSITLGPWQYHFLITEDPALRPYCGDQPGPTTAHSRKCLRSAVLATLDSLRADLY